MTNESETAMPEDRTEDTTPAVDPTAGKHTDEFTPGTEQLPGMNFDIGCLAVESTHGLVQHDPGMRKCEPFPFCPC